MSPLKLKAGSVDTITTRTKRISPTIKLRACLKDTIKTPRTRTVNMRLTA